MFRYNRLAAKYLAASGNIWQNLEVFCGIWKYLAGSERYSLAAIREVLTNALVCAYYSLEGMNPRVAIFLNRLEIENPGMLPFGYTMEDLIAGVSHIRNKAIARAFRELHLMEEWGIVYRRHHRSLADPVGIASLFGKKLERKFVWDSILTQQPKRKP